MIKQSYVYGNIRVTIRDSAPAPLFVRRNVVDPKPMLAWARGLGLKGIINTEDAHVTVAYSRTPVDWFALQGDPSDLLIMPGGPRRLEILGKPGNQVVVLRFASAPLQYRWNYFCQQGCSWDWSEYSPHVTLAQSAGNVDIERALAWPGEFVLGAEIFGPVKDAKG